MGAQPSASWEEIVDRVTIKSNYYNVGDAEMGWRTVFAFLTELHDNLKTLKTNTESWRGGAADGFRDRLEDYIKNIDSLVKDHERIADGLNACADHLRDAVRTIPIPTWMLGKLEDQQSSYQTGSEVLGYPPGSFANFYLKDVVGDLITKIPISGGYWKKFESWFMDQEKTAKRAYAKLQGDYGGQIPHIPSGNPVQAKVAGDVPPFDPTGFTPGGPGGKVPGLDTAGMDASGLDAGAGPGFSNTGLPATDPGLDPGGFDPSAGTLPGAGGGDLPELGSGLAGAGGLGGAGSGLGVPGGGVGGLGGLPSGGAGSGLGGLGAGGLGPGGAGGLGAGGLRGGGLGAVPLGGAGAGRGGARAGAGRGGRVPGLGPGVTPPAGMLGGRGGAGGVAGRGGATARGAGAGRGAGFVPGAGAGRGGVGHDQDHDSWLQEDEDVWGVDGGEPPAVLGA